MIFSAITWSVKPQLLELGSLEIRWYGLLFAASFYFGYIIMKKIFTKEAIPEAVLDKLTMYMAIGVIAGARLGHCFFYEPGHYLAHPIEIIMVWKGGLASHGAAIGILISLFYFSKKVKKPYFWILDRIVIVVALSGFFIRMGNLMNSEIYGHATQLPWGFIFALNGETVPKHPTQIYEALAYLCIFVLLYRMYFRKATLFNGQLFSLSIILIFTARFLLEFFKEVQVDFEKGMFLNMGQLLSLPFIAIGLFLYFYQRKKQAA